MYLPYTNTIMNKIIIIIPFLLVSTLFLAQTQSNDWKLYKNNDSTTVTIDTVKELKKATTPGKVKINKDARIDKLSQQLGTPTDGISVKIHGYRLQVIASSSKEAIDGERSKVVGLRNDVPTYIDYRQPNFRLKVGDFRTKLEAQKLLNELKDIFPTAIVVNDMIELPKIEQIKSE